MSNSSDDQISGNLNGGQHPLQSIEEDQVSGNLNGKQHPLKLIEEDQQSVSDLQAGHSEIESNDGSQLSKSRKRKAYTTKTKLDAVEYSKKHSKISASCKFNVSQSRIQEWVKQEQELREQSNTAKRLPGAGRHLTFGELDDRLAQWVREQIAAKKKVSRRIIRQQALKTFVRDDDNDKEFKGSIGWLDKFMERHNFLARMQTTVCQKPLLEYEQALVNFVMHVSQLREKTKYSHMFACDETAVWLDPSGGKCIAEKGAKEVSVLTTGHDKMRVTVMLTGRSDGYKPIPYVLLDRKRVDPVIVEKIKGKLYLAWKETTWMNDDLIVDYLKRVLGQFPFGKRLLVWDSFRCHLKTRNKADNIPLKKQLKWCGIDNAVVPGGCTKFIQAPDLCWNAPFKAKICQLYEDWMVHREKAITKGGNPKSAPMSVYLQWIIDAWESLPKELVQN